MNLRADIEIEFCSGDRVATCRHQWDLLPVLPAKGSTLNGLAIHLTTIRRVRVIGLDFAMDGPCVVIRAQPISGGQLTDDDFEQACGMLDMHGWWVCSGEWREDPETGDWDLYYDDDEDDGEPV